jgi:hypothetical protein
MAQAAFDEVLEAIEHLPADEQAELLEVVRRRLAERGRRDSCGPRTTRGGCVRS